MRTWARYALLAAAIAAAGVVLGSLLVPAARDAIAFAAGTALSVQLVAFALLLRARGRPTAVLAAWVAGVLLRMGVVAGVALWLTRGGPYEARTALLALVALLMALALLEPPVLRRLEKPNR